MYEKLGYALSEDITLTIEFGEMENGNVHAFLERFGFEVVACNRQAAAESLTQMFEEYADYFMRNKLYETSKEHLSDLPYVLKLYLNREFIIEQNR